MHDPDLRMAFATAIAAGSRAMLLDEQKKRSGVDVDCRCCRE